MFSKDRELWRQRVLRGLPPRKRIELNWEREFLGSFDDTPYARARWHALNRGFIFPEQFNEDELEAIELSNDWLRVQNELRGREDRAREVCDIVGYGPKFRFVKLTGMDLGSPRARDITAITTWSPDVGYEVMYLES